MLKANDKIYRTVRQDFDETGISEVVRSRQKETYCLQISMRHYS